MPPNPPIIVTEDLRLVRGRGAGAWSRAAPDLRLARGERLAVIGPSGAGKTSLIRALAGLDPVAGGRLEVAGVALAGRSEGFRRAFRLRHLGLVFQTFGLLPQLSARENVLLPFRLGAGPLDGAARARAEALLAAVGLANAADRKPQALSVGEQQRVALCRALAPRPALVLADEPTASLDPAGADRALDLLFAQLAALTDASLVCVTHAAEQRARFDRVLELAA